jgi:hypothetical protein
MSRPTPHHDLRAYAFQVLPLGITVVTYVRRPRERSVPSARVPRQQVAADLEQVV